MSDTQTIAPWAEKTIELAESEGHWAGLAAWCIWAGQNWYDQDAADGRDTIDDIGHYVLYCKLVDIADAEIERLRAEVSDKEQIVNGAVQAAMDNAKEIERLQAIIDAKLHKRKCFECGHVSWCADGIRPYCLCDECGSQDTRRLKGGL